MGQIEGLQVDMDLVITAPLAGDGAYTGHPEANRVAAQASRNGVVTGEQQVSGS